MCDEPKPSARTDTPALRPFPVRGIAGFSAPIDVYLAADVDALIKEARELLDGLEISRNQCGVYNGKTWIERRAAFLKATEGVK
jgi:hypothetical protein